MGTYDFDLTQGDDWTLVVTWLQPGTVNPDGSYNLDGPPVNITGWTAAMNIKEFEKATTALAVGTCVVDGPNGKITITLTRQQTAALPNETPLKFDVYVYQPSGPGGRHLVRGTITLHEAVTSG